ncbi:hypothetical protein ACSQ67_005847 [Phaseolus vulgaris]
MTVRAGGIGAWARRYQISSFILLSLAYRQQGIAANLVGSEVPILCILVIYVDDSETLYRLWRGRGDGYKVVQLVILFVLSCSF